MPTPINVTQIAAELNDERTAVHLNLLVAPTDGTPGYVIAIPLEGETAATLGGQLIAKGAVALSKSASGLTLVRGALAG